ncbi:recombinase family protein [Flexibacterium corallicola]|uniref:recombinase family protein n=1 Tax=Flexibacterium corallicola TaxID=3037259 RepID=UPI00286EEC82|nr:recombinase family protein [Pseudovibrio sp. M1P-2-3]
MVVHGYIRTDEYEDSADKQARELEEFGCTSLHWDEGVKRRTFIKPAFKKMMQATTPGDALVFCSLDRVAEYQNDIAEFFTVCETLRLHVVVLREDLDTREDPSIFRTMAALNAFAADLRQERRAAKISSRAGRPAKLSAEDRNKARKLMGAGSSIAATARDLGCSRPTLYAMIREDEATETNKHGAQVDIEDLLKLVNEKAR